MNARATILLVDDDSRFRFALATELRASGYLVQSAEDGQRATGMIEDGGEPWADIDLVITDLVMPRKDGLELCKTIRKKNMDIPVLVITGFLSPNIQRELERLGCTDFLEKPFSPQEFLSKVELMLLHRAADSRQ